MKRMGAAAALLLVALLVCLWGQWQVERDTAKLQQYTEQLYRQTTQKNDLAAAETAALLQEEWETTAPRLCLWLNHSLLSDCQRMITLLPELCREKNRTEILLACTRLQEQLEHLVRSEEPRWENIF